MQCGDAVLTFGRSAGRAKANARRSTKEPDKPPIQQDDLFKERMQNIFDGGLRYAIAMEFDPANAEKLKNAKVKPCNVKDVIVVGAGMSGLVIAYELDQIGHNVTILELQSRVGGRCKTFYHGFSDGQHSDDFVHNNRRYSDTFWPGWDANIGNDAKNKLGIHGILDYFDQTVKPVITELGEDPTEEDWTRWVAKWSKFSTEDFLRSENYSRPDKLKLQPWPEKAIEGYKVSSYTPDISGSLVDTLREILGGWWQDELQTPRDGMSALPNAFLNKNENGWNKDVDLRKSIRYGFKVQSITREKDDLKLTISGMNVATGKAESYTCDAVFATVPLNILRQMEIPLLSQEKQEAIAGITYAASTKSHAAMQDKILAKDVGQGGFSKTSDLIGQLHYPDDDRSTIPDDSRGILLVYTWAQDALTLGSQSYKEAIATAVHEISKIHPEIEHEFEVGNVQAWFSDPAAQGGYASLKPYEYLDHLQSLWKSEHPLYLAGEAISWSNGWIQGALFSGLSQAFAFQARFEGVKECLPWRC